MKGSEIEKDLYRSRNVRQYGDKGFVAFGGIANAWLLSRGAFPRPQEGRAGHRG